jgi:type VI secretion system protein ImpM
MPSPITPRLPVEGLSLLGKLPAQADFVRVNAGSPLVGAFDRWLHEAVEAVRGTGGPILRGPAQVLFRAPGVPSVLLGTLVPSQDRVGREFPLALVASVPAAEVARHLSIVPAAYAPFYAAAEDLLQEAAHLPVPEVARRLADLPLADDAATAEQTLRVVLRRAQAGEWIARVFPSGPAGQHFYGFGTVLRACEPLRQRESEALGVTLDCPVRAATDRLVWLELARRLLDWSAAPPTLLWADVPEPRLLVSLGPAPTSMLRYLARREPEATRLWPLTTERPDAIESVRQALGSRHREALEDPHLSLEALLEAVAQP